MAVDFLRRFYVDADKNAPKSKETKTLKLEAAAAKELANKLADAFLKADSSRSMSVYFQMRSAMSVIEKIIPERAALLKQKQETMKKSLPEEMTRFDGVFDSDDKSPDKMVGNAAKMPTEMRGFMYRNAVNEAVKDGSTDTVRASLNQAPAGKERDEAIAYLDSKVAESKIKDGKIDEARRLIDSLGSTKEKVERLVQLAISFQQKNTKEDSETAAKLMTEARGLIDYSPEDEDAANDFLRIVSEGGDDLARPLPGAGAWRGGQHPDRRLEHQVGDPGAGHAARDLGADEGRGAAGRDLAPQERGSPRD
jgi:hypothetical protein